MPKYRIVWTETFQFDMNIEADTLEEAKEIAFFKTEGSIGCDATILDQEFLVSEEVGE